MATKSQGSMEMDVASGHRIIDLRGRVVSNFDAGNWEEIGLLTGASPIIKGHSRLLRSLAWGDEDYAGNALVVLSAIAHQNPAALSIIEDYLETRFPGESVFISAKPSERKITFAPSVFTVPQAGVESDLVTAMMPFGAAFSPVHDAISAACQETGRRCLRADDIWEESTIIQDVFNLIFRAHVVVVDFSGKNPNVMYETGIAHTLGKHVIPISQSLDDVPFDIKHHRVLKYLPNSEGMLALKSSLAAKLRQVSP
ncbi:hypothetical protein [Stenotrophomonas sp. NPDC077461]|uniref:hypothetical protein n=1 Tax=Stenotrophomonas sp. NPDC077461 TaxID=3414698 RepID=UPI003C2B9554